MFFIFKRYNMNMFALFFFLELRVQLFGHVLRERLEQQPDVSFCSGAQRRNLDAGHVETIEQVFSSLGDLRGHQVACIFNDHRRDAKQLEF